MCRVQSTCGKQKYLWLYNHLSPHQAHATLAVFVFEWVKDQLSGCYITALPCYVFGEGVGVPDYCPVVLRAHFCCVWYIWFSSCCVLFTYLQSVFFSSWNKIIKGSGRPVSSHTSASISELLLKAPCVCHRVKFLHDCYSKYGKVIA